MSIRVDSSPLIAGAVVVGDPGLGVLAEAVPSTGEHGAGYLYTSLEFPADAGKEVRGLITPWPTLGTLTAFEDSSFKYDGPGETFAFQMYVDGVAVGTPKPFTITVGATATIEPATGHIVARGYVPTVQQGDAQAIAPQTGHIQATGYAPAIQQPRTIAPQTGHAQLSGHAPITVQGMSIVIAPQTGHVSARGYAPGVAQGGAVTISPQAGHVRWRGSAPGISTMSVTLPPAYRTYLVPAPLRAHCVRSPSGTYQGRP